MVYFSGTGTTEKTVKTIAHRLSNRLNIPIFEDCINAPSARERVRVFPENDIVLVGMPTYAGRLPNKIAPFFSNKMNGDRTVAIPVVLFGNRSFDNSLAELCGLLTANHFRIPAAGAFVGQHCFSAKLATGRPNSNDLVEMEQFADRIADRLHTDDFPCVTVPGTADAPYYTPEARMETP